MTLQVNARLMFVILAASMLAGCSDAPRTGDETDGSLKYNNVDADSKTHGYVAGIILTEAGNPVPGALVTILSVDRSATSDATGGFNFTDVAKGEQTLRVEKQGYRTLQRPFTVAAGKIVEVEVVLALAGGLGDGEIDHYHDHWRGQELYTIYEGRLEFDTDVTQVPPTFCGYFGIAVPSDECYKQWQLVPDEGRIVPPGTYRISIDISFEPGPFFETADSLYLYMYPPPGPSGVAYSSKYWQVSSGDAHFDYDLPSPEITDHGHTKYTNWQFQLSHSSLVGGLTWASAYNLLFASPIDITVTAHKGDLFIDPPHPRYWEKSDRLPMPAGNPAYVYCTVPADMGSALYLCDERNPNPSVSHGTGDRLSSCYPGCTVLSRGGFVPPGTTRLGLDLETWYSGMTQVGGEPPGGIPPTDFRLGYKTAAAPRGAATWDDYSWADPLESYDPAAQDDRYGAEGRRFMIDVQPGQEDAIYTVFSQWIFTLGVRDHEEAAYWNDLACGSYQCGNLRFEMKNVVVYNDKQEQGTPA